ncbi:AbrB/MazE/SpoVT family DNA-binding domain-containing protein [Almyronema epifaneia]|uniref:AbrB/MazE/SpoVT family DNA-binding domain-containing protein n=1 Tax=Almyronema epifaneia S1 TaxID=2991925 RepID=A0ABW6IL85_9CYAN
MQNHTVLLDAEGRLALPESVRQQLGLTVGDRFILTISENNVLQLVSLKKQVQSLRGLLKNPTPEQSVVDELIQERRRSAISE